VKFDGVSLAPLLRGQPMPQLAERTLVVQFGGLVDCAADEVGLRGIAESLAAGAGQGAVRHPGRRGTEEYVPFSKPTW